MPDLAWMVTPPVGACALVRVGAVGGTQVPPCASVGGRKPARGRKCERMRASPCGCATHTARGPLGATYVHAIRLDCSCTDPPPPLASVAAAVTPHAASLICLQIK